MSANPQSGMNFSVVMLFVILIRVRKYRKCSSVPSVLNSVMVTNHWM